MASTELPDLIVADGEAWQEWLGENHETSSGVWLVLAKKNTTGPTSLTYDLALDEALCYGWIDGQVRRRDESTYRQRFTPRGARSQWSARNVGIVSRLVRQGRMQPAGMNQVARAKADGRWGRSELRPGQYRRADRVGHGSVGSAGAGDVRDLHEPEPLRDVSPDRWCPSPPRCKPGASRSLWPCSAETIHPQKRTLGR